MRLYLADADSDASSSTNHSTTGPASRAMIHHSELSVPSLRPPPCFSRAHPVQEYGPSTDDDDDMSGQHHPAGRRSTVMSSFHLHKGRRRHRTPSMEDDPFWMAMVACTNGAGIRGSDTREKRVHGSTIDFEQCMPHPTSGGSAVIHRSGKSAPPRHLCSEKSDGFAEAACASQACAVASKAFKALNLAKSEVHGRWKALLQQQQSSPVDMSCSRRLAKKPGFTAKLKKKADVFGCKSDHSSIVLP